MKIPIKIMIEILNDITKKKKTKKLYTKCFDDSSLFVDFYYDDICLNNIIIDVLIDGEVVSMCHLNPYKLNIEGKIIDAYYIVAVATEKRYRKMGYMTLVLNKAFEYMKEKNVPFCFLMPVNPKIYEKIGFREIGNFELNKDISYEYIKTHFDIYCIQDDRYRYIRRKERLIDEIAPSGEPLQNPIIMAKIPDIESFGKSINRNFDTESDAIEYLKKKTKFFQEDI